MSPELSSDEQRAFVEAAAESTAELLSMLSRVSESYVSLAPAGATLTAEQRFEARVLAEEIAAVWGRADRAGATHPVVQEESGAEPASALLAAVQDSLVLALFREPAAGPAIASTDEVVARVEQAVADGAWHAAPVSPRSVPSAEIPADSVERFDGLEMRLLEVTTDAAVAFPRIAPDGGELNEKQVAACRDQLVTLAACDRELDLERDLIGRLMERRDLRPTVAVLRLMVQALVLRLSEDPAHEADRIPLTDLAGRFMFVREDWRTWE